MTAPSPDEALRQRIRDCGGGAMRLQPQMVNFHGMPHGGAIFSLADYAFSVACNAHGETAVALSVTIQFLAAAAPGARLTAEARAERQGRQAGFYVKAVTDEQGRGGGAG